VSSGVTARRRVGKVVGGSLGLVLALCASTSVAPAAVGSRILFALGTPVPRPVQEFAWHVIETQCNYQAYEREQRSFFAYDARAVQTGAGVVYSINILADLTWKKSEPPAFIEMTVVDEGRIRLAALRSSFVVCRDAGAARALQTP
jgi:hypothetical protein